MLKSGSELRRRDLYLNRLIAFQDAEPEDHNRHPALRKIQPDEADDPSSAGDWCGG